ncbi:hypothetical protein [Paraburkholderia haematera]|jgi:hypothetical protein|uniref:Uncharacterized protein n=1 Tax=Paraburkholderia haematera TaxID=2793077 RepID=A0ABM8RXV6_9BURK|nr:hypothetical protein [Paraburkholderia haematera]CAE6777874.1 hypothetical protein R69888_04160 [Paraburkholderia haematera]
MKIDTTSGDLAICGAVIPASLTLSEALVSAMFQRRTKVLENGPFVSYKVESICGNCKYISTLYFLSGALESISVNVADPDSAKGWENWSQAEEQKKLQFLVDQLIRQGIINGQHFPWGNVNASYDQRAGESSITIRYLRP